MMHSTTYIVLMIGPTRYRLPEGLDYRGAKEVLQPGHLLITLR